MSTVCLVNGSLRGAKASSLVFLRALERRLPDEQFQKTTVTVSPSVRGRYSRDYLERIASADAIVFVFPLYAYGLPGALMRLLEDLSDHIKSGAGRNTCARVYAIVNCGFPRPEVTTSEAIRVLKNLCRRLGFSWRFAVCIGTGPAVVMTSRVPFLDSKLKKAFAEMASDIQGRDVAVKDNCFIRPVIPEFILLRIKEYYERKGNLIERKEG